MALQTSIDNRSQTLTTETTIVAGTTVTAGTGLVATTGGVTATGNSSVSGGTIVLNATGTNLIDATGNLELNSSAGVINIGQDAVNQNINVGTAGTRTITIGSATGSAAIPNVAITGGSITGITDLAVADGGTGVSTMTTAYAPVCAGTTATGALQVASTGLGTSGFVLTSNGSAALPSFQVLPAGGLTWNSVAGTTQAMAANNGYFTLNAGATTLTLPSSITAGQVMRVAGHGAGGWIVAQNASQTIHFDGANTTTGVGGSLASTVRYDAVELLCTVTDLDFVVISSMGNITIV